MLEQVFKLSENKTNVRTEIVAGITTFLTMAYIIFVNPAILGEAGMPFGAVFVGDLRGRRHRLLPDGLPRQLPDRARARHGAQRLLRLRRGRRHGLQLAGGAGLRLHLGRHLLHHQRAADPRMDRQRHPACRSRWRSPPASACSWR